MAFSIALAVLQALAAQVLRLAVFTGVTAVVTTLVTKRVAAAKENFNVFEIIVSVSLKPGNKSMLNFYKSQINSNVNELIRSVLVFQKVFTVILHLCNGLSNIIQSQMRTPFTKSFINIRRPTAG